MTAPTPIAALSLVDSDPAELDVDAIVVGLHSAPDPNGAGDAEPEANGPLLAPGAESVAAAFEGSLAATLALLGATGAPGEVTKLATLGRIAAPVIAAVGLGGVPGDGGVPTDVLRRAAASAVRALAGADRVLLALPTASESTVDGLALKAIAEGGALGTYRFAGYKTKPNHRKAPVRTVTIHVDDAAESTATAQVDRAAVIARAVARTRDWINTAPNDLRPPAFAESVADAARAAGLEVEVLDEEALQDGGYGGILAVGVGSEAQPRLVRLAYTPPQPGKLIALVGKGITFDTGGYAIKPPQGMWEMKADMSGAAAVAAALLAVAELRPEVAVVGYLPIAENMISGTAYRPGDVVTMYGGKRVEVLNTDAEGRMVLADAIVRAGEDNPDYLVETSTLTGGQVVALGKKVSGLMGDAELIERVKQAGDRAGEPGWPMPLPDDVRKSMESDIADILQVSAGMDRSAHMLQGGVFLREFVPEGLPWAHIDIAGPAYHAGEATGYLTKGGTAVPLRTLLELIDDIGTHG